MIETLLTGLFTGLFFLMKNPLVFLILMCSIALAVLIHNYLHNT